MGGKSSSSSSNATYQYDNRVGAEGEGVAFGTNANVTITDGGAVNAALANNQAVTSQVLDSGQAVFVDAINFAAGVLDRANSTISDTQKQLSTTSQQALSLADQFTRSDSTEVLQSAIKWGGGAMAAYFIFKGLK